MRTLILLGLLASCRDPAPAPETLGDPRPATPVASDARPAVPVNTHTQRHVVPRREGPIEPAFYATQFSQTPTVAQLAAIGALAFRDKTLSHQGTLACASCHDPEHAFGPGRDRPGLRVAPSLKYLQAIPHFTEHYVDAELDTGEDQGPAGGLTWDGRAQSLHDQAKVPLYDPEEMANGSAHELVGKLVRAAYAATVKAAFGADIFADEAKAEKALLLAIEVYQQDASVFAPFTSKYDDVVRGTAELTPAEARGKQLFDDPAKGNCARCHPDVGHSPMFSDYGYVAIGAPAGTSKNLDLGLCGPVRTDLAQHPEYCGKFRTPSLRNVATRRRFFHAGAVRSLRDVVRFYATRDTAPASWSSGLPAAYAANLDRQAPFGGTPGGPPALTEAEITDIVAFLTTLTDR